MAGILALSGWGQPFDALAPLLPEARHLDYAEHADSGAALHAIAEAGENCELAVGWSLGGQLLVRAMAAQLIRPKKLVLIAPPFQFVRSPELKLGLPREQFEKFRDNYARDPKRTLNKAWELVIKGDSQAAAITGRIKQEGKSSALATDWLAWLYVLDGYTCAGLLLDDFPPTLLIHGDRDAVVWHEQSEYFANLIPHSRLETFSGCGHAPHWHDEARVRQLIGEHADV